MNLKLKEELIEYLKDNGKTHSWVELYEMFPFKGKGLVRKKASDIVRKLYKVNISTENHIDSFISEASVKRVKIWDRADGTIGKSIQYDSQKQEELNKIKELKSELIEAIKGIKKPIFTIKEKETETGKTDLLAYEISLPDFHFGKATGETIEEQKLLFLNTVAVLIDRVKNLNIEQIILPIGNDILNSEGVRQTTTKGTPQHDNANWMLSFRTAWTAVIEAINYLSHFAPVQVICVHGNHDYERSFYIGELLAAYYENSTIVNVDNSFSPRKYFPYGNNLLGYTHGDSEKPHDLPLIMATEVPINFASAKYRAWRLGHLHKHMHDEYRGVEVTFLPSICGNDEWHNKMGYYSLRRAQGYIWSKTRGKEGYIQLNYE